MICRIRDSYACSLSGRVRRAMLTVTGSRLVIDMKRPF